METIFTQMRGLLYLFILVWIDAELPAKAAASCGKDVSFMSDMGSILNGARPFIYQANWLQKHKWSQF